MTDCANIEVGFICSLGHSGSTILELNLAEHPNVVGLGVVGSLIQWKEMLPRYCSCGALAADCDFWGDVLPEVIQMRGRGVGESAAYAHILQAASKKFPGSLFLDSSKNIGPWKWLRATGAKVRVIRLTRDVRSWSISSIDKLGRRNFKSKGFRQKIGYSVWGRFRVWYRMNQYLDLSLGQADVARFGYEEYISNHQPGIERMWKFLELGPPSEKDPKTHITHSIGGNQDTIVSPERRSSVHYSTRWLTRSEWVLPALLMTRTMRYNAEAVYGQVRANPLDLYSARPPAGGRTA